MSDTVVVTVKMPWEMVEALDRLAYKLRMSRSELVRAAVKELLRNPNISRELNRRVCFITIRKVTIR